MQIKTAALRAAGLTRQILAFSRQQVLELKVLDFNVVINEFKKMPQSLIGEDIELRTFLAPSLYRIKADRGQIEQVLLNLAVNSRKTGIDLLLTDVIMPEMDGKELYLKLVAIHPNCKVLYMSGYANNVIGHHGILDESENFLQKPFAIRTLARKVRDVLI